jgi:hypothetical protein
LQWWAYASNVMKLSPVDVKNMKAEVPEGVLRLGGTFVLDGDQVSRLYRLSSRKHRVAVSCIQSVGRSFHFAALSSRIKLPPQLRLLPVHLRGAGKVAEIRGHQHHDVFHGTLDESRDTVPP